MAYTPNEWQCGDVISAEKMNNIEEGIQEALDCCSGGGSADVGYECVETRNVVFEGNLTTASVGSFAMATFEPSEELSDDSIIVTLNDTEYELPKEAFGFDFGYGNFNENDIPIFTNYPCAVGYSGTYYFFTPSADTYSVKVESVGTRVIVTDCFEKAVNEVIDKVEIVNVVVQIGDTTTATADKTATELMIAAQRGYPIVANVCEENRGTSTWWNAVAYKISNSAYGNQIFFHNVEYAVNPLRINRQVSVRIDDNSVIYNVVT